MLCSISTGKSGSNWLDRLRSSKGFPTGDNLDLDHFLTNPNPSDSPITDASNSPNSNTESTHSNDKELQNRKAPPPEVVSSEPAGDKEWFGIMSNVLSELFNMGDQAQTSRFSRKKTSRKQTNPKICIIKTSNVNTSEEQKSSSDSVRKDENIPASTTSLNSKEEAKREWKEEGDDYNVEEEEQDEEKEKGERELLGYSRSEVTVIDTSCDVWKVDKLIFRRKNIWKVKDKKGKSRIVGRKKRKAPPPPPPPSYDDNNVGVWNKKRKISSSELRSLTDTSGKESGSLTNHNAPGDKGELVCNETPDDLTQVLRKRFPFSRLPRKSGKGSTSVVLIKSIPTGKKNGAKLAKNRLKDTQRL
ncbi:uncharacterized protein LOC110429180 isoform X2 [Herrania umbratica]|uniref:Uncharacterized protein LOC110429180 isoform X2 n=1 Tax=Herrania umbratica TaxID=108875 RepID=A0A6J1BMW9_9ROSI|nr:uncharacterized protein LOC110429180 isoform X2 [Herrania umbratica]